MKPKQGNKISEHAKLEFMIVCEIVKTGFDVRYVLVSDERGWKVSRESDNELCNYPCFVLYLYQARKLYYVFFKFNRKGRILPKFSNVEELNVNLLLFIQ